MTLWPLPSQRGITSGMRTVRRLSRILIILCVSFASPSLHDALVDTAAWLSGAECCVDDCEDGAPCASLCSHCVSTAHHVMPPRVDRVVVAVAGALQAEVVEPVGHARSGHLDPPFRPPAS